MAAVEDLTLQQIAQLFEQELGATTQTTVAPGTISPVGVLSAAGKRKLSWPEFIKKYHAGIGLTSQEIIPEAVGATGPFYRAGITSGFLPAGMSTFLQSDLGGFAQRMDVAAGVAPSTAVAEEISGETSQAAQKVIASTATGQRRLISGSPPETAADAREHEEERHEMFLLGGIGMQLPGPRPGLVDFLTGGITGVVAQLAGQQLDVQNGVLEYNMKLPELDDPNRAERLSALKSAYPHIDIDDLVLYQEKMNLGSTYNVKGEVAVPTDLGAIWEEKGSTGKIPGNVSARQYWDDWGEGSAWKAPTEKPAPPQDVYKTGEEATSTAPITQTETWHPGVGGGDQSSDPTQSYGAPSQWGTWEDESYDYGETEVSEGISPAPGATEAWYASGGQIGMQEGGMAPPMPMPPPQEDIEAPMPPQQGAEADIANLGLVADQGAAQPQNGGEQSVQDDVAMQANEGDYILPYETVLLVGLKQLNRYAREAIKLAMENDISLKGTDIDPTDDVPIKVSNYEYHIPKTLVPFFGGGKKYLDKIRDEGLALRKRLEEENQPSAQQQQPIPTEKPAPPQMAPAPSPPQMAPAPSPPQIAQEGPAPMMQEGGFVPDPKEKDVPTTEAVLEADVSQSSTYNQLQTIERSRKQQQQPPMVDPSGKITPQGFAAPQGYASGKTVYSDAELMEKYTKFKNLPEAVLMAMAIYSEIQSPTKTVHGREQAKLFTQLLMHRASQNKAEFGGGNLRDVILKPGALSGLEWKYDDRHRENFSRMADTNINDPDFLYLLDLSKDAIKNGQKQDTDVGGTVLFVLNPKSYEKEQKERGSERKVPQHLEKGTGMYPLKTVGNLTFYGMPIPGKKPEYTPPMQTGGFVAQAA